MSVPGACLAGETLALFGLAEVHGQIFKGGKMRILKHGWWAMILIAFLVTKISAVEITQAEWDQMKKDIDDLRNKPAQPTIIESGHMETALDNKYGPKATVYTRTGKLRIGALMQLWYYAQPGKDHRGLFDDPNNGIVDSRNGINTDSFRIRRTELHFSMDMTENVTSYVIVDPAREVNNGYPALPIGSANTGLFQRQNLLSPEFLASSPAPKGANSTALLAGVQGGAGGDAAPGRALQDAWIDYHGAIPNHDFVVGQYHPWFGEEGMRTSRELDFVERSQIGFIGDSRDLGASIHGAWWDVDPDAPAYTPNPSGRFQYWLSVEDAAGTFHSAGAYQNRADDNNAKDFGYRVLVRPVWKQETWGSLELGMSSQIGDHGGSGQPDPTTTPVNGLNRRNVWAWRNGAWGYYAPGSVAKGLWLRGEWNNFHDRVAPGSLVNLVGNGDAPSKPFLQDNPHPFTSTGFYAAIGYKMADSVWAKECGGMPSLLKPFEFVARYDSFQGVQVDNPDRPGDTLLYRTNIWTTGFNYYIKGHNAKIQCNYNFVELPSSHRTDFQFHKYNADSLMVNWQVAF